MQSDYGKVELLREPPNFISQTAEMLIGATHKHGNIVGSNSTRDENSLIRDQNLLQGVSHGRIFGSTTRDSEQSCIFRRERLCIESKVR
jgi:hypothetical protein